MATFDPSAACGGSSPYEGELFVLPITPEKPPGSSPGGLVRLWITYVTHCLQAQPAASLEACSGHDAEEERDIVLRVDYHIREGAV